VRSAPGLVARARGIDEIAKKAGLNGESLYKAPGGPVIANQRSHAYCSCLGPNAFSAPRGKWTDVKAAPGRVSQGWKNMTPRRSAAQNRRRSIQSEMQGRANGLRQPASNSCSLQSRDGSLPLGVATVFAAVGWVLILAVSVSVTIISAAAQPSPGAAPSSSAASPRSTYSVSAAKRRSDSRSAPLPNFDALPHRLVPATGVFAGWCGNQDRYLIDNSSEGFFRLFAPTSDDPLVQIRISALLQCDREGGNIVFAQSSAGAISVFNVDRRATETLARYQQLDASKPPILTISPDLKAVAYVPETVRFTPESWGPGIKLLPLTAGEGEHTGIIRWKADASMLFHVTRSRPVTEDHNGYSETISVIDTETARTVQGKLPTGFSFMSGSFLDSGRELVVFMRPRRKDRPELRPPGTVFRCSVAPFACSRLVVSVDHVSMNEHGLLGTVAMIYSDGRDPHDSDSLVVPNRYVIGALNVDGRILIRQELPGYSNKDPSRALIDVRVHVSPSGQRAILEWGAMCETNRGLPSCPFRKVVALPKQG